MSYGEHGDDLRLLHAMSDTLRQRVANMSRPSWEETWILTANIMSLRGTCPRRKVGCVITDGDQVFLSQGYNGAPRGLPHCTDDGVGCRIDGLGRCTRTIHAEMNAIFNAVRNGVSLYGSHVYCTDRPCINCAQALVQVGIREIMWSNDHLHPDERDAVLDIFGAANITMRVANYGSLSV
jgi:dCMP deaminase